MNRTSRAFAALALSLVAGLPAAAQCTYFVPYVPDFDQKRIAAPGIPGLPNDGSVHCVPTSITNWFAYFANRGITQPLGLNGPRNWQSNVNYNLVTSQIQLMGSLMGTAPPGGTNGTGGLGGAMLYSLAMAQNKIAISRVHGGHFDGVNPGSAALTHTLGGFVAVCYGRYNLDTQGRYNRDGGHCMTLAGQIDGCSSGTSTLRVRDPASDGYNSTQSVFVTSDVTVNPVTAVFYSSSSGAFVDTRWRFNSGNGVKFVDSMYLLYPRVALCPSVTFPNVITVHHPFVIEGLNIPSTQPITLPGGLGAIRSLTMSPTVLNYHAITAPIGGVSRLFEIDPVTLAPTERMTGNDFRYMEVNRFGELIICDGSVIKLINPRTNPPTLINQLTLGGIPRCIGYDDATDTIAYITPPGATASQFVRYNRGLTALHSSGPLPAGVSPTGNFSLAFGRTGGIFLCGDGTASIFRMSQSGNVLSMLPSITLPAGSTPTGLNVDDDDHVLFASGGLIREYELDPNNRYALSPNPAFAGFPAAGRLFIPRSRTNHIPALHEGPGFEDIVNPEVLPGVADCPANCDFSTIPPVLNVLDFACYLNMFAAGKIEANCDGSTTPPVLNVLDFACFLNQFASGCP